MLLAVSVRLPPAVTGLGLATKEPICVPSRASFATYQIPVVALILGVVFRDETVHVLSVIGIGLVIAGALLASRRERAA